MLVFGNKAVGQNLVLVERCGDDIYNIFDMAVQNVQKVNAKEAESILLKGDKLN